MFPRLHSRTRIGSLLIGLSLGLSACQTGGGQNLTAPADARLTEAELSELQVTFETARFEPAARSTETLLKRLGYQDPRHRSACKGQPFYDDQGERAGTAKAKNERALLYVANGWRQAAMHALKYGNFADALDYIRTAAARMPIRWNGYIAGMRFTESVLYSMVGFDAEAATAYGSGLGLMSADRSSGAKRERMLRRVSSTRNAARAFVLRADGDLRQAELLLRAAATLTHSVRDGLSRTLLSYFHVLTLVDLNRFGEAEVIARELALQQQDPLYTMWAYDALAIVFLRQGRFAEAEEVARHAHVFFKKRCAPTHYFVVARAGLRLAQALTGLGRWDDSLVLFEEINRASGRDGSGVTESVLLGTPDWGVALMAAGRPAEAVRRFDASVPVITRLYGEKSLAALETEAFRRFAAFEAQGKNGPLDTFEAAMDRLAKALAGETAESTDAAGRERRLAFLTDRYIAAAATLGDTGRAATALRYAQLGRGGKVQAALAAGAVRLEVDDPALNDLVRKQQNAASRAQDLNHLILARSSMAAAEDEDVSVADLVEERKRLETASRQLLVDIETRFPDFSALITNRPIGADALKKSLRADEAVVFIRTGQEATFVWVARPQGRIALHAAPLSVDVIEKIVRRLRRGVDPTTIQTIADIPEFAIQPARQLHAALIEPALSTIGSARKLIVIADGPLRQLPFSLLVSDAPDRSLGPEDDADGLLFTRYRKVTWLADTHAITVLPTLNALGLLRRGIAKSAPKALIAFGDPYFSEAQAARAVREVADGVAGRRGIGDLAVRSLPETRALNSALLENLPRLPETRSEIAAIGEALGADPERDILLGDRASEDAVKAAPLDLYRNVVFATHGLVAGDLDGLYEPALAMSSPKVSGGGGDGLLTMSEILNLKMNADWVVLSACNTAAADGDGAEAIAGLGRAFFYAGARSLLVSNWPVHSSATEALTTTAFTRIRDDGVGRAEAMRRARVALIRQEEYTTRDGRRLFSYAHPLFWAPFVVVGEGG